MKNFSQKISIVLAVLLVSIVALFSSLFLTYFALDSVGLFPIDSEASLFNSQKIKVDGNISNSEDVLNNRSENSSNDNANANLISNGSKSVIPLGGVFGIKIYTDGIIVGALESFNIAGENVCPAKIAGIKEGDFILSVENETITNNEQFKYLISKYITKTFTLTIKRDEKIFDTEITAVEDEDCYRLGMWVRDSAAGIGTLTYYDPDTGVFAGLGHGICDVDTDELLVLKNGSPASIEISHIEKSVNNNPGQICGFFDTDENLGDLIANEETGIYGHLKEIPIGKSYEVAKKTEIEKGKATVIATLENGKTDQYEIKIEEISDYNSNVKNMIIKVVDEELLDKAGGILQGMSGSPIIQNGKLIGAVTHVFVNDPKKGYAIFIENMLETEMKIK